MSGIALIDSSAWLFTLGPSPVEKVRERVYSLVDSNSAAVAAPVLFELLSFPAPDEKRKRLGDFLSGLHHFPIHDSDWRDAADWTAGLRTQGLKVKSMDALIAYVAHKHNLILVHADSDLDRIASKSRLKVESLVETVRKAGRTDV